MAGKSPETKEKPKTSPEKRASETEGGLAEFFEDYFLPGVGTLSLAAGLFPLSALCLGVWLLDQKDTEPHILKGFFGKALDF